VFLTISTTGTPERPASDLGFLLHKHPDHAQAFDTSYGTAHVLYPEASAERCTAALLLEVDPVALVRRGKGKGRGGAPDAALAQYVNDRPYAASFLLATALSSVFSSAMKGRCRARPELVAEALPLRVEVPALPARGGPGLVTRLFTPLGWTVTAEPVPLDDTFPEWGDSRYVRLVLEGRLRLAEALCHLYVLLPVLDDAKHYWVAPDEVDKLLRAGEGWLSGHPEEALITSRYLARRWSLTRQARERLELLRLAESDDSGVEEIDNAVEDAPDDEDLTGAVPAAAAPAGGPPAAPDPDPCEAAVAAPHAAGPPHADPDAAGPVFADLDAAGLSPADLDAAGPVLPDLDAAGPPPAGQAPAGGTPAAGGRPAGPDETAGDHTGPGPSGENRSGNEDAAQNRTGDDGTGPHPTSEARTGPHLTAEDRTGQHPAAPAPPSLGVQRRAAILKELRAAGAARVLDLGCGQGQLVQELLKDSRFTEIVGVDVSMRALAVATRRLRLDRMGERQAERVRLLQGSLAYTDRRLKGYDAAVLCEVIEHLDLPRLPALEYAVFGAARPRTVLVTTPNVEYNVRWESLPAGQARHGDHRFEWTRGEFSGWAQKVAARHGYGVHFVPIGPDDPEVGPPTQMAVFTLADAGRTQRTPGAPRPERAKGERAA
jgi:SAM-dependent methyltransferase